MPTDDLFEAAWEAVYDVEKGFFDDFKAARQHYNTQRVAQDAHNRVYANALQQLWREKAPGLPTMDEYRAALHNDALYPESAQITEDDSPDDSPDDPPMGVEQALQILAPDPPEGVVVPDVDEIVVPKEAEQISEPPVETGESTPPSERITEQISKPPKPPEGATAPEPGDIVDTTETLPESEPEPLDDDATPTNESELDDFAEEVAGQPRPTEQTGFQFPTSQDKLTGHKHKGGLRQAQTSLTDSPMEALQHAEKVPLMDVQGNPVKMGKRTGWYARMSKSGRGVEVFNEAEPKEAWPVEDVMRTAGVTNQWGSPVNLPSGTPQLPTKKIGPATSGNWIHPAKRKAKHMQDHSTRGMTEMRDGERVLGEAGLKEMDKRRRAVESETRNRKPVGTGVYYPMPGTYALDRKTGEKIASESMAVDDAWTVVKNPHANPFTDFNSVLAINEQKPPERAFTPSDPIIMKEETPLQKLRQNGFDMNQGDNLSLLPSNMLLDEDMGIQDNMSLLPTGWRNE